MAIQRITTSPADGQIDGSYTFVEEYADLNRVNGAFRFRFLESAAFSFPPVAGAVTWHHFRLSKETGGSGILKLRNNLVAFQNDSNDTLAYLDFDPDSENVRLVIEGDTTANGVYGSFQEFANYVVDVRIEVGANISAKFYLNGALISDTQVPNTAGKVGTSRILARANQDSQGQSSFFGSLHIHEMVFADEDTRGMRVRELRPQSFGVFQEWDGGVASIRDDDSSTGISTTLTDARVSFGLSRLNRIGRNDSIDRVVLQTYAQRGENGVPKFNHFLRFADTNVQDSETEFTLQETGDWFVEEFLTNPNTNAEWEVEDLPSLQAGIRSRAA